MIVYSQRSFKLFLTRIEFLHSLEILVKDIAVHTEAAFWQFHRLIGVIVGLEEVEEQHEVVFHVVIEKSYWDACHLATVGAMIHK